jgi:hypothetical protein
MVVRKTRLAPTVADENAGKPYLTPNIDRAIIETQAVLLKFIDTLRLRLPSDHPRFAHPSHLYALIDKLMAVAANAWPNKNGTDPDLIRCFHRCSFENYLAMCKRLAACCDEYEKELIQLIAREIILLHQSWDIKVAAGEIQEFAGYNSLKPLTTRNCHGKIIVALARAFDVEVPSAARPKISNAMIL